MIYVRSDIGSQLNPQYHTFLRMSTPSPLPLSFSVSLGAFTLWLAFVSSITVVEDDLRV